jgi:hypothetical protein
MSGALVRYHPTLDWDSVEDASALPEDIPQASMSPMKFGDYYKVLDVDAHLASLKREHEQQLAGEQKLRQWHSQSIDHLKAMVSERDGQLAALQAELEVERMRNVACGVAALCNTPTSAKEQALSADSPYQSASYQDVMRAVEREMKLRRELAEVTERYAVTAWTTGMDMFSNDHPKRLDSREVGSACAVAIRAIGAARASDGEPK